MIGKVLVVLLAVGVIGTNGADLGDEFKEFKDELTAEQYEILSPLFETVQGLYDKSNKDDLPSKDTERNTVLFNLLIDSLAKSISSDSNELAFDYNTEDLISVEDIFKGIDVKELELEDVESEIKLAVDGVTKIALQVNQTYKNLNIVITKRLLVKVLYIVIRNSYKVLGRAPRTAYCLYSRLPEFHNETLFGAQQLDVCIQETVTAVEEFVGELRDQLNKIKADLLSIKDMLLTCVRRESAVGKAVSCFIRIGRILTELSNARWDADATVKHIAQEVPAISVTGYQCTVNAMKQTVRDIQDTFRTINKCIKFKG